MIVLHLRISLRIIKIRAIVILKEYIVEHTSQSIKVISRESFKLLKIKEGWDIFISQNFKKIIFKVNKLSLEVPKSVHTFL